ncbi:MAG: nitroreductase family protein [Pseudomonas sp.]|jgi:nitroreductase|uniref:nitroreductase family protein n=1 Tax=Pseudomonadaceae TaxID=135621 RepID=UPI000C5C5E9D|nr:MULTISPECIES: nitroreductase family protein [Pseudomonadaceae]MAX89781.1 nitroreductase family protein [Pseudomonas sp.]MBU0810383.1 nitroreductase family protein [Gammaproteobacteria bacterium]MBK3849449.1 nitroreductase family protein [Stutzerimonas xanthomarina]MBU0850823.1 nitroreductase family protein [Gammaproteobacteria bacterium]MBU1303480.1 nitroreductase family protein [Gammaproteobacteria bacterium]|tara:strand:+ start:46981 stop:47583 length:603 start_codon:yes stop_codon:yes gene_type:complete
MQIEEAIQTRRAVKAYDPSFQLSREEKDELLQLALLAPSAFNLQHVRFVEVSNPELRAQIREVGWNQAQMTDASMLVVVCAQVDSWEKNVRRVWDGAPAEVQDYMAGAIDNYYRGKPQVQRDEAMRSCGLMAQTLMLAARGKGLDSCPMDGFDFDAVAKLINLPDNHVIAMMVAVGKRTVDPKPRVGKLPFDEVIIRDRF